MPKAKDKCKRNVSKLASPTQVKKNEKRVRGWKFDVVSYTVPSDHEEDRRKAGMKKKEEKKKRRRKGSGLGGREYIVVEGGLCTPPANFPICASLYEYEVSYSHEPVVVKREGSWERDVMRVKGTWRRRGRERSGQ